MNCKIIADLYRNNGYGEVLALCKAIFNTGYEQGKNEGISSFAVFDKNEPLILEKAIDKLNLKNGESTITKCPFCNGTLTVKCDKDTGHRHAKCDKCEIEYFE